MIPRFMQAWKQMYWGDEAELMNWRSVESLGVKWLYEMKKCLTLAASIFKKHLDLALSKRSL